MKYPKFLIFFLLSFGCKPAAVGPPPVALERLVPLLTDLQIAESIMTTIPAPLRDSMKEVYYAEVLDDHQLDKPGFDSIMGIVRSEPEWIHAVFVAVNDELAKREAEGKRQAPEIRE